MKKSFKIWPALLLCTLALALLPATVTQAKQKNQGKMGKNVTWSYNEKKKVLTISGKGYAKAANLREYKDGEYLWLGREDGVLPMFQKIVFQEGITKIDHRFFCLENVKSISLPKSFKEIQYYSKYSIRNINGQFDPWSTTLKKITVNKKNKKFKASGGVLLSKNGKKLYVFPSGKTSDTYKISDKVNSIERYAFWGTDIRQVTLGEKVTRIEAHAFYNSTVKEVVFGKSVKRIGASAFQDCTLSQLKLPESLTYIDSYAFSACPLTELTIPANVTSIKDYAFANNQKLKKIVIQGNTSIGFGVFRLTAKHYIQKEPTVSELIDEPITVVLGKKMKANVNDLCNSLGSRITFQVEAGNPKYYAKDGNLYTIRGDKLVYERKQEEGKTETPPADTATGGAVQI